jgi:hypothetical protein
MPAKAASSAATTESPTILAALKQAAFTALSVVPFAPADPANTLCTVLAEGFQGAGNPVESARKALLAAGVTPRAVRRFDTFAGPCIIVEGVPSIGNPMTAAGTP